MVCRCLLSIFNTRCDGSTIGRPLRRRQPLVPLVETSVVVGTNAVVVCGCLVAHMTITAKENTVHQDDNEHTRRVEVDDQNIVDIIVLLESINFVLFYFIFLFFFEMMLLRSTNVGLLNMIHVESRR